MVDTQTEIPGQENDTRLQYLQGVCRQAIPGCSHRPLADIPHRSEQTFSAYGSLFRLTPHLQDKQDWRRQGIHTYIHLCGPTSSASWGNQVPNGYRIPKESECVYHSEDSNSKTKLTFRPHPREYFPAFYASRCACVIHSWIPEGVVGRWVLSLSNLGLSSLHGDLLYSSPRAPSSARFWTVQLLILTVSSRHSCRLTYKFYGAWWLRVATWRCFSGFMVKRNSCSTSLACLLSDWIRFSRKKSCFGSIGARVCCQAPTLPLYYEGKAMKTTFPQNYVYVLRTAKTRHMVSFIDFYFHFPANFQT